jgi:Zn-dependent peptidase ImmA (M78 family)
VLASLRALAPRRALAISEAVLVAERQAVALLGLAQLAAPPTPNALITELPRIRVRTDADLPASGGTQWVSGRWVILINGSEPVARQRFSLAHEYKHALDHRHRNVLYVDRPGISAAEEAELAADAFAAALLMPQAWVLDAWRAGHRRLSDLADMFAVSPQAMARRLDTLALRTRTTYPRDGRRAA